MFYLRNNIIIHNLHTVENVREMRTNIILYYKLYIRFFIFAGPLNLHITHAYIRSRVKNDVTRRPRDKDTAVINSVVGIIPKTSGERSRDARLAKTWRLHCQISRRIRLTTSHTAVRFKPTFFFFFFCSAVIVNDRNRHVIFVAQTAVFIIYSFN